MTDTLVVYFSRSGVTERLASQLASRLGADLEVIRTNESYTGVRGYLKGVWQSLLRRMPAVSRGTDPAGYTNVIVCSPIWVGHLSAPMHSYLARFGAGIGPLAAIWVSGGGAAYKNVATEIERLTGHALLASSSFGEREVGTPAANAKLEALVQTLHTRRYKTA